LSLPPVLASSQFKQTKSLALGGPAPMLRIALKSHTATLLQAGRKFPRSTAKKAFFTQESVDLFRLPRQDCLLGREIYLQPKSAQRKNTRNLTMKKITVLTILAVTGLVLGGCNKESADALKQNADDAKQAVETKTEEAKDAAAKKIDEATEKAKEAAPAAAAAVDNMAEKAKDATMNAADATKDAADKAVDKVQDAASNAMDSAKDAVAPSATPSP
jgi:hypothetical protein